MKAKPVRKRARRGLLAAAAGAALGAAACGFVGADMFPRELQYLDASFDLAGLLGVEADGLADIRIERLAGSGGAARVAVFARRPGINELVVLDDALRPLRSYFDDSFSRFLGVDQAGDFACGSALVPYDTSSGPVAGTNQGCDESCLDVAGSSLVLRVVDGAAGSVLNARVKTLTDSYAVDSPAVDGTYFSSMDSSVLGASDRLFLLLRDRSSGTSLLSIGFPDSYADPLAMLSAVLTGSQLDSVAGLSYTWVLGYSSDGGWITEDGIVALVHGNGSRLARFDLSSGEELDSLPIDSDWMQGLSFEDDGEYWYYYDRRTGSVNKLRTWWSR